jgi:hypothetical protein
MAGVKDIVSSEAASNGVRRLASIIDDRGQPPIDPGLQSGVRTRNENKTVFNSFPARLVLQQPEQARINFDYQPMNPPTPPLKYSRLEILWSLALGIWSFISPHAARSTQHTPRIGQHRLRSAHIGCHPHLMVAATQWPAQRLTAQVAGGKIGRDKRGYWSPGTGMAAPVSYSSTSVANCSDCSRPAGYNPGRSDRSRKN